VADQPWKDNRGTPERHNASGYVTHKLSLYDKNGRPLYHHTWYNTQTDRRISYDTYDAGFGVGHVYVDGSGHEVDNRTGLVVNRWDGTTAYNRYDNYGHVAEVVYPR